MANSHSNITLKTKAHGVATKLNFFRLMSWPVYEAAWHLEYNYNIYYFFYI